MKTIPGAKKELARGFSSVNTPRKHIEEIYMVLSTKRDELVKKRQQLDSMLRNPSLPPNERKHIREMMRQNNEAFKGLRERTRKQVDINSFMVAHLRAYVTPEQFAMAARLAKTEAKEALDHIAWVTDGDGNADMATND